MNLTLLHCRSSSQYSDYWILYQKNDLQLLDNQSQDVEIQRKLSFQSKFYRNSTKNDLDKIQNLIDKDDELITLRKSIKRQFGTIRKRCNHHQRLFARSKC